jgi:hypothetical protein
VGVENIDLVIPDQSAQFADSSEIHAAKRIDAMRH